MWYTINLKTNKVELNVLYEKLGHKKWENGWSFVVGHTMVECLIVCV